jgi:hypothetical protein
MLQGASSTRPDGPTPAPKVRPDPMLGEAVADGERRGGCTIVHADLGVDARQMVLDSLLAYEFRLTPYRKLRSCGRLGV